jgi:hypothetical protein
MLRSWKITQFSSKFFHLLITIESGYWLDSGQLRLNPGKIFLIRKLVILHVCNSSCWFLQLKH